MHEDDDRGRAEGRSSGGSRGGTSWWGWFGGALDRLLAQRAADVDATYSRLGEREPVVPDGVAKGRAGERARRGRESTRIDRQRGRHRAMRWFRLRFVVATVGARLALR